MDDAQGYSGNQAEEEEAIDEMAELKATLMEMRMELDGHRWRNAHLEAEKLAKTLDLKDA
jgi:ClpP class serine protease